MHYGKKRLEAGNVQVKYLLKTVFRELGSDGFHRTAEGGRERDPRAKLKGEVGMEKEAVITAASVRKLLNVSPE